MFTRFANTLANSLLTRFGKITWKLTASGVVFGFETFRLVENPKAKWGFNFISVNWVALGTDPVKAKMKVETSNLNGLPWYDGNHKIPMILH